MLTGENGILTQASKSKTETQIRTAEEKVKLEVLGSYNTNGKLDKDLLTENLENVEELTYNGNAVDKDTNPITSLPATVVVDGVYVDIKANGQVKKGMPLVLEAPTATKVRENTRYQDAESENKIAVIPAGFAVVPGCTKIDEGLVISDVANDITDVGNQFVWIPVTSASQYVRNRTYESTNISSTAYTDTGYLPEEIQPQIDEASSNEEAERSTVVEAGGFYISRYEAGDEDATEERTGAATDGTLVSKKNKYVYSSISPWTAKSKAKTFIDNENVKSALISGIQWDVTMATINGKLDGKGNTYNVTTASNDATTSDRHTGSKAKTGENVADKVYNIYDLEGNFYEYVAEKNTHNTSYPYVIRGGKYDVTKSASSRQFYYDMGSTYIYMSFRLVLYVM